MTNKHRRQGAWADWRKCYTGSVPDATQTGIPAQQIWQWLTQWRQQEYVASYSGRVDKTINGNGTSSFYIITNFPDKKDTVTTTRQLGAYIKCWDVSFAGVGDLDADWHDPHGGAGTAIWDLDSDVWSGTDDTATSKAHGPEKFFYDNMTVTPAGATDDGFRQSKLVINNACVACLSVWEMPETDLSDAQLQVSGASVSAGEIIRGYDTTAGDSLGALIHLTGDGASATESMERNRRCLFQTPYPSGVYQANTGGYEHHRQDSDGNAFKYRVRVRNLQGKSAGTQLAYPALVVTADAGVDIKYSSTTAADTWTYTVPGGGVTNALVTYSDGTGGTGVGLEVDNDAVETVTIEVDAGVAEECTLHTVALFEGPDWT